jgi:hypothetical protein
MTTKIHDLKIWPEPFAAIVRGDKHHEFRKDDRGFEVGDVLELRSWNPETSSYGLGFIAMRVTYISRGPSFGIPDGYCVMSVEPQELKPCKREAIAEGRKKTMTTKLKDRRFFPELTFEELRDGPVTLTDPDSKGVTLRQWMAVQLAAGCIVRAPLEMTDDTRHQWASEVIRLTDALLAALEEE